MGSKYHPLVTDRPVLALLDGHSLAFRAFYALPPDMRTTTGQLTNAVYGFTTMLIKLLGEQRPDGIGAVFDRGRPAQRVELVPDYKANRIETPDDFRSQLPLIFEVLDTLAIPQVSVEGEEADDLIATYATLAEEQGWDTLVVSGDRDVFQLINDHVRVLYTRRGITDTVIMDAAAVEERYGVEPARYPMLAALRGDPSDNIAGVPGVGDKTAAKLLNDFGDLDGIFANLDQIKGKRLPGELAEHRDAVMAGHQVVILRRDVEIPAPIEALRMGEIDADAVRRLFATLEFRSLWDRLSEAVLADQQARAAVGFSDDPLRLGPGGLAAWLDERPRGQAIAVLPFLDSRPPTVRWRAVAVAAEGARPATIQLGDATGGDLGALAGELSDPDRPLLVHDAKRLLHAAASRGWIVDAVADDTELAAYLVAPAQRNFDLETLALQYLNKQLRTTTGEGGDEEGPAQLAMVVEDDWAERCLRASALLELSGVLGKELAEREQTSLLTDLELPLAPVLRDMEQTGIAVEPSVLEEMSDSLGDQIRDLRRRIFEAAGHEFNLDSPKQLQVVLFDELGLPKTRRMKTGYSTDASELTRIIDTHPIVEPLLEYREISKLKGTYIDALPPLVSPVTGRIHAEFNQTVAVTGRLSSQNPNMQNIPIRTAMGREIRRAFVPGEGFSSLLVADYSQIELRVMAHLTGDEGLLSAFRSGEDIHATTAARVFEIPLESVDGTTRNRIKFMTYGLAYGLSSFGLAQQLGIPPDEARELQEAYFDRFPRVRDFLRGIVEQARRDGYTSTLFGRRRYLPDLVSDNRQRREMAERMALNAPIQGTAADIIKKAMVAVRDAMIAARMRSQLLLQVHDELVCETAPGEEQALRDLLVERMSGIVNLAVPLEVDTASGPSWAEAEKH
jgi:DNA polymerase I